MDILHMKMQYFMEELLRTSVKKILWCSYPFTGHIILERNKGQAVTQIVWTERVKSVKDKILSGASTWCSWKASFK